MRRVLGIVLLCSGLAGCGSSPTETASDQPLPPSLRATAFTVTQNFEFSQLVFIQCANGGAGEDVTLSGTLHDVFHVTINGNKFVLKTHDQPQGVTGVGAITGDIYHATGVTQETTTSGLVGFTDAFVNSFKIIGPGPSNNVLIQGVVHFTVNANGTLTVARDQFTAECR
jgi:hypothetical protein